MNRIVELSRQLRTFLNYKECTILEICRDKENSLNFTNLKTTNLEMELNQVYLDYSSFIEKNIKEVVNFYLNLGWEIRDDLIMMSYVPDKNLYKMRI